MPQPKPQPTPALAAALATALEAFMEKIQRALATQGAAPLPAPELRFFTHRLDAGRALASPTPGAPGILELNLIYLEREPWESSRATVGHELAHLVVFHLHPHRRRCRGDPARRARGRLPPRRGVCRARLGLLGGAGAGNMLVVNQESDNGSIVRIQQKGTDVIKVEYTKNIGLSISDK